MTSKAERLRSRSSPCGRMPLLRSSPPTVIYMMKVSVACLTCVVWCAVAVRGEDIVDDYQSFADVATSDTEEAEEQSQRQRVARLSGQVDEMLEELRNQNEAIFKHAGHNRILSGKVSELSRDVKLLREQNDDLRQKMQLAEFKAARKIKKVKARLADVTGRLDLCKCPETPLTDSVGFKQTLDVSTDGNKQPKKTTSKLVRNEDKRRSNERRKRRRKRKKQDKKEKKDKDKKRTFSMLKNHVRHHSLELDQSWRLTDFNHILITTGSRNSSEILTPDLAYGHDFCLEPAPYPLKVEGAVGTFIDGRPMVCGGRTSVEDYHADCHVYNVNNDTWIRTTSMMERRFQATAVMLSATQWWITGGFSGTYVFNNTEIYDAKTAEFHHGPNMPGEATFQHCLVKFNATHIFAVGGFPYSNEAWILDFPSARWTEQRSIPHIRDAPHCAMVERLNGKVEIVVAGGSLPGSELSTEIFSPDENRWRTGPNLPKAIIYGVSVPYRNTLLILGGREMGGDLGELERIYEYDNVKEAWKENSQNRLRKSRTSFVAIGLPNYLSCTNNFKPHSVTRGLPTTTPAYPYQSLDEERRRNNRFYGSF